MWLGDFLPRETGADRQYIYLFLSCISISLSSDASLKITLSVYTNTNHICFKTNRKTWKVTSIRSDFFFHYLKRINIFCEENFFFVVCFVEKSFFYLSLLMVCQLLSATFLVVCEINISVSLSINKSNKDDFFHYHAWSNLLLFGFYSTCDYPWFFTFSFFFHKIFYQKAGI